MSRSVLATARPGGVLLALLVLLSTGPAQAAPAPVKVTWSDVVRLVERHPRLTAGALQIEAARRSVTAAGAVPNPTLEATVGHGLARAGGAQRVEWGLALTVPLGWIAQRRSRIEAAAAEVDVARAESRILRREVLIQLGTLFWETAHEQARVVAFEALEAQTAALVRTVKRRVDAKDLRPVEALRVEIELEKVGIELASARAALRGRQAVLALWIGLPGGQDLVVTADLETLPRAPEAITALARARANHPALAVARAKTHLLEAEIRVERRARTPAFSFNIFAAGELDRHAYGVGLSIDLPLWNWNAGRIAQAERKLAAGRRQAESVALEVESAVLVAQAACQASVGTATRYRTGVVPRAESAAATMERTYLLGDTSLLEAIDARRTLLEARRLLLGALAQAQLDCSRLGILTGEDPR